jgi:hypothetical protein
MEGHHSRKVAVKRIAVNMDDCRLTCVSNAVHDTVDSRIAVFEVHRFVFVKLQDVRSLVNIELKNGPYLRLVYEIGESNHVAMRVVDNRVKF